MLPSINPRVHRVRDVVHEKSVVVAYPESLEPSIRELSSQGDNAFIDSLARSVSEKFSQYKVEAEVQRRKMFPKRESPFVK